MGCKQSYMIGRATDTKGYLVTAPSATAVVLVNPNAARIGLYITADVSALITAGDCVLVGPIGSNGWIPVATLTPSNPSCYLSIEHLGTALLGKFLALTQGPDSASLYMTDVFLTKKLEDF